VDVETAEIPELDDQGQTRLAIAALFAALVKALERRDVTAVSVFKDRLEEASHEIRNSPTSAPGRSKGLTGLPSC
jgi:hypothetical protein